MTSERKENRKYVFTVEGETEQWYLEWLKEQINTCPMSCYNVSIIARVQQSPKKYAKTVNKTSTPLITHICDYEGNKSDYVKKFQNILSELKEANIAFGRNFKYSLGYSNLTFELWMVLHKQSCNRKLTKSSQYLPFINKAYHEKFESLEEYKREENFKKCLSKLSLKDVCTAIDRAQSIMQEKINNQEKITQYKGFSYYTENPALNLWESIAHILTECHIRK